MLDDKGRLNFPARFREVMGDSFMITRWLDDCLVALSQEEWNNMSSLLVEKSVVKSRKMRRAIYAGAAKALPDKQGRILIPESLRVFGGLKKEVVVIGAGRYAEIWDAAAWEVENAQLDSASMERAMEELDF